MKKLLLINLLILNSFGVTPVFADTDSHLNEEILEFRFISFPGFVQGWLGWRNEGKATMRVMLKKEDNVFINTLHVSHEPIFNLGYEKTPGAFIEVPLLGLFVPDNNIFVGREWMHDDVKFLVESKVDADFFGIRDSFFVITGVPAVCATKDSCTRGVFYYSVENGIRIISKSEGGGGFGDKPVVWISETEKSIGAKLNSN